MRPALFLAVLLGCALAKPPPRRPGRILQTVTVDEGAPLGSIEREYQLYMPSWYDGTAELPLVLYFHGSTACCPPERRLGDPVTAPFDDFAEQLGFFMVYPFGKGASMACGTGWNTVGPKGSLNGTCVPKAWQTKQNCCYESCKKLGRCSRVGVGEVGYCGWTECYDELLFTKTLLAHLKTLVKVRADATFAIGASNGGMLLHMHILPGMPPSTFRAVSGVYGEPFKGFLDVPQFLNGTAILQLHDRFDTEVPVAGGESGDGWLYTPEIELMRKWATVHGCKGGPDAPTQKNATRAARNACSDNPSAVFKYSLTGVQCQGLRQVPAAQDPFECASACCHNFADGRSCSAWQFGYGSCWIGDLDPKGADCGKLDDAWVGGSSRDIPTPPRPLPVLPHGTVPYQTPWSGPVPRNLAHLSCIEFPGCKLHIAQCLYDGPHGGWIHSGNALIIWFFLNQTLGLPWSPDESQMLGK